MTDRSSSALKRRSLAAQAITRQVVVLTAIFAVALVSLSILYFQYNRRTAESESAEILQFYRSRILNLERSWQESALRYRGRLEFMRILEDPKTRMIQLQSYLTAQSAGDPFSQVIILNPSGEVIFRRGPGVEQFEVPSDDRPSWYFDKSREQLFRVYPQPIWLGPTGMGRLILYHHVDDGTLYQSSFPRSDLFLFWKGGLVAKSTPTHPPAPTEILRSCADPTHRPVASESANLTCVAWDSQPTTGPNLVIRTEERRLLTPVEVVALGVVFLALLVLAVWLSLGFWLVTTSRRIQRLSEFSRTFTEDYRLTDSLRRTLASTKTQDDEITEVSNSLENLAGEVIRREDAAQRAIHLRDEFLSIASHELKTPITSLSLQLQIIRRLLSPKEPAAIPVDRVQNFINAGVDQIERLTRLIEELLSVTRIEAGRLVMDFQPCDLTELVRSNVERFAADFRIAECPVIARLEEPITGNWDRFKLEQVVINLFTNAIKFGRGRPIEISVFRDQNLAVLTVRDHGIGIAFEDHPKIFERFGRAVSDRSFGGMGLGLYIAREIIRAHGGTITVESEPGKGALFTVKLPISS